MEGCALAVFVGLHLDLRLVLGADLGLRLGVRKRKDDWPDLWVRNQQGVDHSFREAAWIAANGAHNARWLQLLDRRGQTL